MSAGAISLAPLIEQVVFPAVSAVLTGCAVWLTNQGVKFFKLQITTAQANQMEAAIHHGIQYALSKAEFVVDQNATVPVKSAVVEAAANYIMPKIPGVLKGLGVTAEGLNQRIEARLPSHIVATSAPIPGTDQPIY